MKQKIVIKVPMKKERDRSKAMAIAVGIVGVSSVKIRGEDKDIVVVVGDEVNTVNLAQSLIKRFGSATVVSVERLSRAADDDDEVQAQPNYCYGNYNNNYNQALMVGAQPNYYYNNNIPPPPYRNYCAYERPVDDSNCSIM